MLVSLSFTPSNRIDFAFEKLETDENLDRPLMSSIPPMPPGIIRFSNNPSFVISLSSNAYVGTRSKMLVLVAEPAESLRSNVFNAVVPSVS